jgi:flagellar protein FlaG
MALDVSSISSISTSADSVRRAAAAQAGVDQKEHAPAPSSAEMSAIMSDLQRVGATFNRRLSFSMNEKLGQVVVKVIDTDTDKVIREIPPQELQRVYERIREVIGLLLDEKA